MRVLVTDADSGFAQALLPALCARPGIEGVTGVALQAPRFEHPGLRIVQADYRDPGTFSVLSGHDALLHLGRGGRNETAGSDTVEAAVRPVHKFFHAAHDAGVRRLIHLSTAAVYGSAIHAPESSPLKPLPGFRYAQEQAHLEQLLAIDFPTGVRLRPHLIVGPHAHPAVRSVLRQPFYPRTDEPRPLFQCVHEDDLVSAVMLCLEGDARGAYNIATEDGFSLRDAIRSRHWLTFGLAPPGVGRAIAIANRFLKADIDPIWLERAKHTLLVNCRRAIIELGWRRRHTALEALAAT